MNSDIVYTYQSKNQQIFLLPSPLLLQLYFSYLSPYQIGFFGYFLAEL